MEATGRLYGAAETSPRVHLDPKWVIIGLSVALVAWLALVPLVFLLWQSVMTPETAAKPAVFTWRNYAEAYASGDTLHLFFNSVQFATGTATLALVVGTFFAWVNERTNTPFKALFFAISIVPLIIPGILFTVAWIMLGSPKIGIFNLVLQQWFGFSEPVFNIYSMPGMMWVDGLH